MTFEWSRFFIPSLAPALFLSAGVIYALASRAKGSRWAGTALPPICGASAMVLFGVSSISHVTGYAAAMDSVPLREAGPVIWAQSDPAGEGALIVRRLETDRRRSSYVLRGAKMLSDSSWSGYGYRLLVETPEGVGSLLDEIPVDFILFDTSVPPTPDAELVGRYLSSSASKFSLRHAYPVRGRARSGEIRIYERHSARPPGPVRVSVMLGPERGNRIVSCAGK
jgi:hypothetical protein